MTGDELIAKLQALTPKQRALPVCVLGAGDYIYEAKEVKAHEKGEWHTPGVPKQYLFID